jgi:protein phosphatase
MRLTAAARSDVGRKRDVNEDFLAISAERGVYVVADGLGGHVAGRRASETGVATFLGALSEPSGGKKAERIRSAIRCANAAIREQSERDPSLRGMGTTLVALWLDGEEATIAHVGDSRLYLVRRGRLHPLTLDHSLVAELQARRELSGVQARFHPHRHVITRAVGVVDAVEPDVGSLRVRPGDVFVLCSDGISGQVSEEDVLAAVVSCGIDLGRAVDGLIESANAAGGEDNATVMLVRCDAEESEPRR